MSNHNTTTFLFANVAHLSTHLHFHICAWSADHTSGKVVASSKWFSLAWDLVRTWLLAMT